MSAMETAADGAISRRALLRSAFKPVPAGTDEKILTIGGTCLALNGISCRSCEDVCEPRAIRFKPQLGGAFIPQLDTATCTGCGECLPICPANAIHWEGGRTDE